MNDIHDYAELNRKMWNERAGIHSEHYVQELMQKISAEDFTTFDAVEKDLFSQIGLPGKSVAQLACNNGRELISIKKAGAGRCVGFDISDQFIEQGEQLAAAAKVEIEFVRTNILEIPSGYENQFDLVFLSVGTFGWIERLDDLFEVISTLLKPNGQLFIYEMHPILDMFDADKGPVFDASYFRKEPFLTEEETDYLDASKTIHTPSYWFPHTMADIVGGCLKQHFQIIHFEEYPHDISCEYKEFATLEHRLPLCYSLIAKKT